MMQDVRSPPVLRHRIADCPAVTDPKIIPSKLKDFAGSSPTIPHLGNLNLDPNKPTCVYEDELCAMVARDPNSRDKAFQNADSYACFALAAYMHDLGFDFSEGYVRFRVYQTTKYKSVTKLKDALPTLDIAEVSVLLLEDGLEGLWDNEAA